MLGPRVAPAITYLHGAAVILGDGPVLQRLADQYEQHRLKRKEAVAKVSQSVSQGPGRGAAAGLGSGP